MGFNTEILKLWEIQNVFLYSFAWKYIHIWSLDRFQFSANLESLSYTLFLPHSICAHVYMCVWAFVCVCIPPHLTLFLTHSFSASVYEREREKKRVYLCMCTFPSHTLFLCDSFSSLCSSLCLCVPLSTLPFTLAAM